MVPTNASCSTKGEPGVMTIAVKLNLPTSSGNSNPDTTMTIIYFASAADALDSSHMTASSSASWSRFSPPSNFANGHVSTMRFMVCRWPQSQEGDWARPHLCKLARHMGFDLSTNGAWETTCMTRDDDDDNDKSRSRDVHIDMHKHCSAAS